MASSKTRVLLGVWIAFACQSLCMDALAQKSGKVFRYTNSEGRIVYDSHIPAQYVANGYTILNDRGQVLEVVPRAKTAEEIAEQKKIAEAEEAALKAKQAQEESDQLLIRLYRSPDEIEHKRDNMLGPLNAQIGLLEANIAKIEQTMNEAQTVVDNYRKAGKDAPSDIAARAERSKVEIAGIQNRLNALLADRARIMNDAERDSSRLRMLLDITEQSPTQ